MHKVDIEKRCGCFNHDHTDLPRMYDSKEAAELDGLRLVNHMNTNYCKKHRFHLAMAEDGYMIRVDLACEDAENIQVS